MAWILFFLAAFVVVPVLSVGVGAVRSLEDSTIEPLAEFVLPHRTNMPPGLDAVQRFDPVSAVDDLERIGFSRSGCIKLSLPDHDAIFSVMQSHDRASFAIITPVHMEFYSDFEGKVMTTSTTHASAPMVYELRQKATGSPAEMFRAHQQGLERIAAVGRRPVVLAPDAVLNTAVAIEQHGLANFSAVRQILAPLTLVTRRLGGNPVESPRQIRSWLDSPHRWTWTTD